MSSAIPSQSDVGPVSSSPSSTPTPSDQGGQGLGTSPALSSSAALYLYTFLATLILLLTISAAIIARSYCIRRRQRQLLEEAIRNGTYVPPPPIRPVDPNQKPVLYDVFLDSEGGLVGVHEHRRNASEVESVESDLKAQKNFGTWGSIMPLAAVSEKDVSPPSPPEIVKTPSTATPPTPLHRVWIPRRLRTRQRSNDVPLSVLPTSPSPSTPPTETPSDPPSSPDPESVQLALFIAMPTPQRHQHQHQHSSDHSENDHHADDDEPLPPIEIGFTEVNLRTRINPKSSQGPLGDDEDTGSAESVVGS
ncbi:hypothetical protein NLI96_g11434 [Meripilus lineatus]|uniref:Uncharacterized protein n=1 Tax=Meripilus lineatus TaxID=2056292 RepID=A0AAD5UVX1_9APHY|nr:hypothetical protein NLI96_g11434 [Physisporinus lineatus]